jgi:DNA-binding NarL/FixJ family response regulator
MWLHGFRDTRLCGVSLISKGGMLVALLSETWHEAADGRGESGQEWRRISSLIGDSGVDWVTDPLHRIEELTDREFDVFILLGRGLSNQAISGSLYVTERTVKAHVTRILAKLRLDSRLQAGLVAQAYTHCVALSSR